MNSRESGVLRGTAFPFVMVSFLDETVSIPPYNFSYGICEIGAGGLMQGVFALGMKYVRTWEWENIWLIYSSVALLLLPIVIASATLPHLYAVLQSTPIHISLMVVLFGAGWGVANVLCGLAFPRVGIALSFAIVIGLSASLGSLVPLVALHPAYLVRSSGLCVLAGVSFALCGIGLLGWAKRRREMGGKAGKIVATRNGILLCTAAGILAPMLNFSFAFGDRIISAAVGLGASPQSGVNAVWFLALAGGFLVNAGYCTLLLVRNQTYRRFKVSGAAYNLGLSASMGILWAMGLFCYGWGANRLGNMSAIVGWPMFQAITIVTSTLAGVVSGEWGGAPRWFVNRSCLALSLLLVSVIFISVGNTP